MVLRDLFPVLVKDTEVLEDINFINYDPFMSEGVRKTRIKL